MIMILLGVLKVLVLALLLLELVLLLLVAFVPLLCGRWRWQISIIVLVPPLVEDTNTNSSGKNSLLMMIHHHHHHHHQEAVKQGEEHGDAFLFPVSHSSPCPFHVFFLEDLILALLGVV